MAIIIHETYGSASEWFARCESLGKVTPGEELIRNSVLTDDRNLEFFGGTYADALLLAKTGWQEGRDKMTGALTEAVAITSTRRGKFESLEVAGAYPIVQAFIAGAPDCMVTVGDSERATKPIIRLLCEQWGSCGVDAKQLTNRGAAILAHIDNLESQGYRCEVMARFSCCDTNARKDHAIIDVLAKRADEPLEIDRLAFILAHPATLRRFFFRALECFPDGKSAKFTSGHGYPPKEEARKVAAGEIFIPSANEQTSLYSAIETAATLIGQIIKAGLESLPDCRCDFMDAA